MDRKHLEYYPACKGHLYWDTDGTQHKVAIAFTVEVDLSGEIHIAIEDQPLSNKNFEILKVHHGSSRIVQPLKLEGHNQEGLVFQSNAIHLTNAGTTSTPNKATLKLTAKAQQLTVYTADDTDDSAGSYQAEYLVVGLQWFHGTIFSIAEEKIEISGTVNPEDFSKITGSIIIRSSSNERTFSEWLNVADSTVDRILDVVSFADGHFMRPSTRRAFKDKTLAQIDFTGKGRGSKPYMPPLHPLNYNESLPPLIQAYTQECIDKTGINVAIEWHLMPHLYNEARFISQMTAIEHLIHIFSKQSSDSTYINKNIFRNDIAPKITDTLKQELTKIPLNDEKRENAVQEMGQNLKGINRRSLRSNLDRMMLAYDVPLDDLEDIIGSLIEMRNGIVHRGLSDSKNGKLSKRVAEAEELLRRIILAILGFNGRYTCWLNKIEDKEFRNTV
ncbi:hypothetical protein [Poriferisphaera sp. WC338]|uniref:hypothetical protein n=1 Tax=Poriferisphaera sp. WC338 TaxID=3425129 RepID=UPI003D816F28